MPEVRGNKDPGECDFFLPFKTEKVWLDLRVKMNSNCNFYKANPTFNCTDNSFISFSE